MSEALVTRFYDAFAARDGGAMARCYHADVTFRDPAFGELHGHDAGDMWRMLCATGTDLSVAYDIRTVSPERATVQWVASYTFTATGRPVTNRVTAAMRFAEGLIREHEDNFSFWTWAGQALGLPGRLLGWAPPLQSTVRRRARASLRQYQDRREP